MVHLHLQRTLAWALALTSTVVPLVAAADLPPLRIMPLGDSITKGNKSPDMNGYRGPLREKLLADQKTVDMIGSLRDGSMKDNNHEGHSGKYLADIREYLELSLLAKPNVVLVHAGTNNMDKEVDLDKADSLITSIIDRLFQGSPDAVVLVAPVIWANDPRMQANTDAYNKKLASIIKQKQDKGDHILSVPIDITIADLADKKHPNGAGYGKMATAWYNAIQDAHRRGWIRSPTKVDPDELPGMGLGSGNSITKIGAGNCGDDNWISEGKVFDGFNVWEEVGTIMAPMENANRDKVILADLNNDGYTDYILADNDGTVRAWINLGSSENRWKSIGKINPDWEKVSGDMIHMVDVNSDGKADMIVLYSGGEAKVWENVDDGRKFKTLDAEWATGFDQPGSEVHFQDMDGDGYADYVIVYDGGAIDWARNTHNNGKDDKKKNWEETVQIAPGPAGVPNNRAQLYDLDGNGKADYVVIYEGGAVRAWQNTGSLNNGGRNWENLGTIAPGIEGVTGEMIRFADMDGDGQADFLAVADDGSIRMWRNRGIVGSKGLSLRFADLDGDGDDDIISVDAKGRARAWLNQKDGKWDDIGEIAPGLDEDLSDSTIQFADVNGDGLADFLVVYGGGAVKAYLNNGNIPDQGKDRIWQDGIVISEGVGEPGRKVRFADLNGDGYADYLVVFDGGAVDCWLNQKNIPPKEGRRIWGGRTTVAGGVGETGSKIRFADLTGDGKYDYIVQYDGGSAIGYRNTGNIPDVGKSWNWVNMGTISNSVRPQGPVVYADINGDGKADYLVVFGSGQVHSYVNDCSWKPKGAGDNYDGIGDGVDDGDGGDDGDDDSFPLPDGMDLDEFCKEPSDWTEVDLVEFSEKRMIPKYFDHLFDVKGDSENWATALFNRSVTCSVYGSTDCFFKPSCKETKPPSQFWATFVASNFFQRTNKYGEAFQTNALNESLQVGDVVNDFKIKRPDQIASDTMFSLFSGAIGLAGGATGSIGGGSSAGTPSSAGLSGTVMGAVGTTFSLISTALKGDKPPDEDDMERFINLQLGKIFSAGYNSGEDILIAMFEEGNLEHFPSGLTKGKYGWRVSNFFSEGRYLATMGGAEMKTFRESLGKNMKDSLVGLALLFANYYIVRDGFEKGDCREQTSGMVIDDHCFTLEAIGDGSKVPPERSDFSNPVDKKVLELIKGKYSIDLKELYEISASCQAGRGGYGESVEMESYQPLSERPECFYHLPVFIIDRENSEYPGSWDTPCWARITNMTAQEDDVPVAGETFLPPNLDKLFTQEFCVPGL
ncbi:hypothetical protein FQN52_003627 [Onygenales sp. PD_12]|nr:hypothetical protein FQN52_003627 [Onygenales sp. PD_12]